MELFKGNGWRKTRWGFFGKVEVRGVWGVHREVVVAFMVIATQHPIVIGLSGRSNLGAEVVVFCTPADQTYCHIRCSRGPCHTFMPGLYWVLETGEGLVKPMSLLRKNRTLEWTDVLAWKLANIWSNGYPCLGCQSIQSDLFSFTKVECWEDEHEDFKFIQLLFMWTCHVRCRLKASRWWMSSYWWS